MDSVNNFYEIINDRNKNEQNSIYDELKEKESKYYDTINRVIDLKMNENNINKYFQYTSIENFVINIFITLNIIFKELMNINFNKIDYKELLEIFIKEHRLIYMGVILIFFSIIILLIDVTDN